MNTIKDYTAADISPDDCTAYHTARINTHWMDAEAAPRAAAIVRAFDYIRLQPFRRDLDFFADGLPLDIIQATYEAALIEIKAPGDLLKTVTKEDQATVKKIDILSTTYLAGAQIQYQKLDALLSPYLDGPMVGLSR